MKYLIGAAVLALAAAAGGPAFAGEKTVTLGVANMFCGSCPYIVKQTLARVDGVISVTVSYRRSTAVVRFDDARANVTVLMQATANMGYPSTLKE